MLSPFVWESPRMQGWRSISALFWAPEKAGVRLPLLILSFFVWGSPGMQECQHTLECPVRARAHPNTDKWLFQKWCQEVDVEEVLDPPPQRTHVR